MGKKLHKLGWMLLLAILVLWWTGVVRADPAAPLSVSVGQSYRANFSTGGNGIAAQAGNLTELSINGITVTEVWQGFYGNVTGEFTLQDAQGNSFYQWSTMSAGGEVYASNNSLVNWTAVNCFNFTGNGSEVLNVTLIEPAFNVSDTDVDGFNETFNETYAGQFFIGSRSIDATMQCPQTRTYNSSGVRSEDFVEVLMTDTSNRGLLFVGMLRNDHNGFNNGTHDFQLLVADDGQPGNEDATPYYFFVELT